MRSPSSIGTSRKASTHTSSPAVGRRVTFCGYPSAPPAVAGWRLKQRCSTRTSRAIQYPLDLANLLRQRARDWRDRDYQGATKVTRELIDLWRAADRAQPLFYAQFEAAETVIFLVEGPPDLLQGIRVPTDGPGSAAREAGYKAFQRYAVKMATGSGKTTVMGMLAAWSILNKVADPQNAAYSDTVLIVCPNVTIRDRLQELNPERDELSLYRTRELAPAHRMTELRRGEVFVTNWHNLERRETREVNGQSGRVVKRGQAVEKTRTIKVTTTVTADQILIPGHFGRVGDRGRREEARRHTQGIHRQRDAIPRKRRRVPKARIGRAQRPQLVHPGDERRGAPRLPARLG